MAASASATWAVVGAAITSASISASLAIATASPQPVAPVWRVAAPSIAGSGSPTATSRHSGWAAITRRWLRPMEPRPARATRSGAGVLIAASPALVGASPALVGASSARSSADAGRGDGADRGDDRLEVRFREPGVDGNREHLVGEAIGHRQRQVRGPGEVSLEVGLAVDRDRVVDERADAALGEAVDHLLALPGKPHDVLVPDVAAPGGLRRRQVVGAQVLGQKRGVPPALLGSLVEPAELGEPQRRGEVGGLEVRAQGFVVVADAHPVVSEEAQAIGHVVVVGRREAALARHQVLRGVQADHGGAEPAGPLPAVGGAVRLGRVLHDPQAVARRDLGDRVHVGHEAVEVDRQDRLRARGDGGLDRGRVDAEVLRADVDEDRRGPDAEDRAHGRVEAERDGDHLVARADPERVEDRLEGHGPVGHEDRVPDAAVVGPRLLEGGGPLPHGEHAGPEDLEDGLLLGGADVGTRDRDHRTASSGRATQESRSIRNGVPQDGHVASQARSPGAGAPPAARRRWPQKQTQPMRRAGLPATSAWSGTSRVTTAPAPTVANAPTAVPATTTAPAPIEQPRRSWIGLTVQSSARASSPVRVIARGKRSLVRIALGPMKTPSSTLTPWYT